MDVDKPQGAHRLTQSWCGVDQGRDDSEFAGLLIEEKTHRSIDLLVQECLCQSSMYRKDRGRSARLRRIVFCF